MTDLAPAGAGLTARHGAVPGRRAHTSPGPAAGRGADPAIPR